MRVLSLVLVATLFGCPGPSSLPSEADTDTDTDSDTDSDADADSDADSDADTDIDTGGAFSETQCDDLIDDDGDGFTDCADYDCQQSEPACAGECPPEDAFENNDVLSNATIVPGIFGQTGMMVHGQDEDWFTVEVPDGGIVQALVNFTHLEGDIDLRLVDSSNTQLDSSGSTSNSEEVFWTNNTGAPMSVYLRVFQYGNSCSTYELSIYGGMIPTTEVCGDLFDNDADGFADCADLDCLAEPVCACPPEDSFEPNDTSSTAVAVPTANGLLSHPESPDFFFLIVPAGELASVSASSTGAPVRLSLRNEVGQLLDSSATDVQVLNSSDTEVTWTLEVSSDVCAGYDLTSSVAPPPPEDCVDTLDNDFDGRADCFDYDCITAAACAAECGPDDALEPNQTLVTASTITAEAGLRLHIDNPDFFRFDVPQGELLDVSASFLHADGDLSLRLRDETGAILASSSSASDDEQIVRINEADEGVSWFVEVAFATDSVPCTTYDLEGNVGPVPDEDCADTVDNDLDGLVDCDDYDCVNAPECTADCATEDLYEPNDDVASAISIPATAELTVHRQSEDWFQITALPGEVVRGTFDFAAGEGRRLSMRLRDESGLVVGSTVSNGGLATVYAINEDVEQTYSLQVEVLNATGAPCTVYELEFSSQPIPPEDCENSVDDDLDGVIDCLDLDCAGVAACAGVCGPEDVFEPNDSRADAYSGVTSEAGLLAHRQSDDWFAYDVFAGDLVNLSIDFVDAEGNLDLRLYDSSGAVLDTSTTGSDGEAVQWLNDGPTQTIFARVNVVSISETCNTYDLLFDASPPPPEDCGDGTDNDIDGATDCADYDCWDATECSGSCPGDEDVFEDNDRVEDAQFLFGQELELFVHAQDPDWFALFATEGDLIEVELNHDPFNGARVGVSLFDEQGVLVKSNVSASATKVLNILAPHDGDYFVEVATTYAVCNTYDLFVSAAPPPPEVCSDGVDNDWDGVVDCGDYDCIGVATCTCPEEDIFGGVNNTFDNAVDVQTMTDLSVHQQRPDFFQLQLDDGSSAEITVAFSDAAGNIDLRVYDESGVDVGGATSLSDDEALLFINDAGGDRQYTIAVEMAGDVCNAYDLSYIASALVDEICTNTNDDDGDGEIGCDDRDCALDLSSGCGCSEDALEPNDHAAVAFFNEYSYLGGWVLRQSPDVWGYTVAPGDTLEVVVAHSFADGDIDVRLVDAQGNLLRSGVSSNDDEVFAWTHLGEQSMDVFLQIYLWSGSSASCNSYDLTVTLQ